MKYLKIISIEFVKTKSEKVLARADVHFEGFLLKGFKILRNLENKDYVTPPSYLSPKGWRQLFKTDSEEDWKDIQHRILEEYDKHLINESLEESHE